MKDAAEGAAMRMMERRVRQFVPETGTIGRQARLREAPPNAFDKRPLSEEDKS